MVLAVIALLVNHYFSVPTSLLEKAHGHFGGDYTTSTGYNDLVLPKEWRRVGGVEALTDILMCGLSAGCFFVVFARVFGPTWGSPPAA